MKSINMDWQNLFSRRILDRGYNYFCDGAVMDLRISDESVSATVEGTEDYETEVTLSNGYVEDMSCTCPYAEEGNYCKHMAAVLYAWTERLLNADKYKTKSGDMDDGENENSKTKTVIANDKGQSNLKNDYDRQKATVSSKKKSGDKELSIQSVVDAADISELKKFLVSALEEDETLFIRFKAAVMKKTTKSDVTRLKAHINAIANRHMDRHGFIDYYAAGDFVMDLSEVIDKDVRRIMDAGDCMNAFDLLNYIFELAANVAIDDSGGETETVLSEIFDLWADLQEKATLQEKQEMFRWFTSHLGCYETDWVDEYMEDIILQEFNGEEFRQSKLDFVQMKMEESAKKTDHWHRNYETGKWAKKYLMLINPSTEDNPEFKKVIDKYWFVSDVRKYYIDFCIKAKRYDRALQVLDESIAIDKEWAGTVTGYQEQKKEIFRMQGNLEAYKEQLWELLVKYKPDDLDLFRELKKQYTQNEWPEQREILFSRLPKSAHMDRLYAEERLLDRLLDYVLKSDIYYVVQYTELLKDKHPEELLQRYREALERMARNTGTRKHYSELVGLLRRMQRIRGGKETVKAIVAGWREQYRNRPAMLDELRKGKL